MTSSSRDKPSDESSGDQPHPIDRHVGRRIRLRRNLLGLNQVQLATRLGVTFQQVQKYESGSNRISASRLFDMAAALTLPIGYFFDDLPPGLSEPEAPTDFIPRHPLLDEEVGFEATQEMVEFVQAYFSIPSASARKSFRALVHDVADAALPSGKRGET